jgi:hypothetical protein
MVEPIFSAPIFMDFILPFILVFTLVFAILQKTKLFGESTKQINAILGLVIGLILIAFPFSRDFVVLLMPFLAVSIVILLMFMMVYGFIWNHKDDPLQNKWVKVAVSVVFVLALITIVLLVGGWWDGVYNFLFERETSSQIWVNALLVVVIGAAVIAVLKGKEEDNEKDK